MYALKYVRDFRRERLKQKQSFFLYGRGSFVKGKKERADVAHWVRPVNRTLCLALTGSPTLSGDLGRFIPPSSGRGEGNSPEEQSD